MAEAGKKITIDSVAALAGVSKTTVSRYLNGKYSMLSSETKLRIERVIKELDYHPNRIAQSLKSRSSRMIGCVVSDIGSPFSSILVKGINSVCTKSGYQLLLVDCEDSPESERRAIKSLMDSQVDGLIVNSTGENDEYLLELSQGGMPLVMADRCLSIEGKIDTVCTDNYESTCNCVRFLKSMGYARVCFFAAQVGRIMPRVLRYRGYMDSMQEVFGMDGSESTYFYQKENDNHGCEKALMQLMIEHPDERVAILAVNGVALLDVLNAMQSLKVQIGERIGVCGFDNWGWADLIGPGITTITQNSWKVGSLSAELLLQRIEGKGTEEMQFIQLPNRLEVRGSTVQR